MDTKEQEAMFREALTSYPGTKRGFNTEFYNFVRKHKDWKEVLPLLLPAISKQQKVHEWLKGNNSFCPPWKHFQTWINNRCWEDEFPEYEAANPPRTPQDSKTPPKPAVVAPQIKVSTIEERRKIAEEHEWRIK